MPAYTYVKEKNFYRFTNLDDDKTYSLDTNTGLFYSPTGKAIKSMPKGFGKYLDNQRTNNPVMYLLTRVRNSPCQFGLHEHGIYTLRTMSPFAEPQIVKYLNLCDRLASIGYDTERSGAWRDFEPDTLDFIGENFAAFANFYRTHEDCGIRDFINEHAFEIFVKKTHLDAPRYHLNEEEIHDVYTIINDQRGRYKEMFLKHLDVIAYFVGRGLVTFCDGSVYNCASKLEKFFNLCDKLNREPQKEDFYRQYINYSREYAIRKRQLDEAALVRHQTEHKDALTFEDENFVVVIPTTEKEFSDEANAQNNCVYSTYFPKVVDGQTNVVFVRKKNFPTISYITCEVRDGIIQQFLFRYNAWVGSDSIAENNFRNAYEKHLRANW